jgi:hypothetical protein
LEKIGCILLYTPNEHQGVKKAFSQMYSGPEESIEGYSVIYKDLGGLDFYSDLFRFSTQKHIRSETILFSHNEI